MNSAQRLQAAYYRAELIVNAAIADAWEEAMLEIISDDARIWSFTPIRIYNRTVGISKRILVAQLDPRVNRRWVSEPTTDCQPF